MFKKGIYVYHSARASRIGYSLSESAKDRIHAPNALAVLAGQAPGSTAASVPQMFLKGNSQYGPYSKAPTIC